MNLPKLKARIAGAIKRAGQDGISLSDLYGIIYANELPPLPGHGVLKVHIWQMRHWYGLPIEGRRGGTHEGGYRWRRHPFLMKEAAE